MKLTAKEAKEMADLAILRDKVIDNILKEIGNKAKNKQYWMFLVTSTSSIKNLKELLANTNALNSIFNQTTINILKNVTFIESIDKIGDWVIEGELRKLGYKVNNENRDFSLSYHDNNNESRRLTTSISYYIIKWDVT